MAIPALPQRSRRERPGGRPGRARRGRGARGAADQAAAQPGPARGTGRVAELLAGPGTAAARQKRDPGLPPQSRRYPARPPGPSPRGARRGLGAFSAGGAPANNRLARAANAELRVIALDLERPTADFTEVPAM